VIVRSITNRWRSEQISWDELWLTQAYLMSMRSRCSRDRVGAVIVNAQNELVGAGYNGAAPTDQHDTGGWCRDWCERAKTYPRGQSAPANGYVDCPSSHAEINALLRRHGDLSGAAIYITALPCYNCAKFIAACHSTDGLSRVVVPHDGLPAYREPDTVLGYLGDCGLQVDRIVVP